MRPNCKIPGFECSPTTAHAEITRFERGSFGPKKLCQILPPDSLHAILRSIDNCGCLQIDSAFAPALPAYVRKDHSEATEERSESGDCYGPRSPIHYSGIACIIEDGGITILLAQRAQPGKDLSLTDLGKRVREERLRKGISLEELSDRARVSRSMISEVERGTKAATVLVLTGLQQDSRPALRACLQPK